MNWYGNPMVTKGKSKANQCEAEAEQELSREVAGGRCSSHVSSTWATGMVLNQRRCQPTSEWCVVFCALSPGSLWKVCIQISLGGTTEHPLGKRASFWGAWVHSFFCFGSQSDRSWFMYLKSWASIATVVSPGMAAAAQREWTGKKEPDLVINCMTAFVKEERQERGIFLWAFF